MIPLDEVPVYLIECGLLEPSAIHEGRLRVVDASRRNVNCKVVVDAGPAYFLKQETGPASGTGVLPGTVAAEVAALRVLETGGQLPGGPRTPRVVRYDQPAGVLVLDLLPSRDNLRHHFMRTGRLSTTLSEACGGALGTLHATTPDLAATRRLPARLPEVLSIGLPSLASWRAAGAGTTALLRLLQRHPDLTSALGALAGEWQPRCLVHGDPRWDNWLLLQPNSGRLGLVDWEFGAFGDPGWDSGFLLGEYLAGWVLSVPEIPGLSREQALPLASCSVDRVRSAMAAFWRGYVRARGLSGAESAFELVRSMCFAALKLVVSASELATTRRELGADVGGLLQLAANILAAPRDATQALLGEDLIRPRAAA